ncbi:MAG TPA: hypothetical protein V6D20_22140 [Candidatus Obscuribacterales bacterium]
MNTAYDSFQKANDCFRRSAHQRWHRHQSQLHILRSQLGFSEVASSRPSVCRGCAHYHGVAYGQARDSRTLLICGFHPYGWQGQTCPDWQPDETCAP